MNVIDPTTISLISGITTGLILLITKLVNYIIGNNDKDIVKIVLEREKKIVDLATKTIEAIESFDKIMGKNNDIIDDISNDIDKIKIELIKTNSDRFRCMDKLNRILGDKRDD